MRSFYKENSYTKIPITLTYDLKLTRDFFHANVDVDVVILI